MKKTIFIILLCTQFGCDSPEYKFDYLFSNIEDKYSITIHHHYSDDFIPKSWIKPPISGKGYQIETKDIKKMPSIINSFLSKYSKEFVKRNLSNIYLLKKLCFYDKNYGGTSSKSGIYIVNDDQTNNRLLGLMHSEFSSIILRNYKDFFPFQKWKSINNSDFKYIGRGVDMLGQDNLDEQTEYLLSQGFIVKYGTSSLENDFNMFVDWMFTHPEEVRSYILKYPRVREKYKIIHKFYLDINSGVIIKNKTF